MAFNFVNFVADGETENEQGQESPMEEDLSGEDDREEVLHRIRTRQGKIYE